MTPFLVGTRRGLVTLDGSRSQPALEGRSITALLVGPVDRWALVDGTEVWRGGAGRGWEVVAHGEDLACLGSSPSGLLVGTGGAHLRRLEGDRLEAVAAFEAVEARDRWHTPWGGPPTTRWLADDGSGTVYAGVHVGGIVASVDGGRSWRASAFDIDADVHQVRAGMAPGKVLAACARGLASSDDRGGHWRIETEGLHATYARAVAVAGDVVIMSASTGPGTDRGALYRRPLTGEQPFERCRAGLPEWFAHNVDTGCLVAAASDVAVGTPDGTVYASTDQGATWKQVASDLAPVTCTAAA